MSVSKSSAPKSTGPRSATAANPESFWSDRPFFWGTALLLLITVIAYLPVLRAGFIWDDDSMLTNNPFVRTSSGLYYIWCTTTLPDYFPLTSTSLWLEWRLWGLHPVGYHITNLLLHVASAVLLWRVLNRLAIPAPWLAALLFAVHPVNVESVAWITERKNTLCLFFFLLSLLWYLRAESRQALSTHPQSSTLNSQPPYYWLSLLAFLCALLSKTAVVMSPFVLLLCVWWQRRPPTHSPVHPQLTRLPLRDLQRTLPFFALSLALGLVTVWFQYHRAIADDIVHTSDFWTRLAGAGWSVWFYLYKALLPLNLSFVYPRWEIDSHSVYSYLPMLALVLVFAFCWRYRRGWGRPILFGLGFFVLMLLPVLGFLNIYFQRYSLVADHWQYFSIIGLIALVVGVASSRLQASSARPRSAGPRLAAAACVACLAILTWKQAGVYANPESLWRDTLNKNPQAWLAHNNWGQVLADRGRLDEAMTHYAEALRIQPDQVEARNNLGSVLLDLGRLDEAAAQFTAALKVNPRLAMAHYNLGNVADRRGDRAQAIAQYRRALELRPEYPDAHNNLGCLLASDGNLEQATFHFRQALRFKPDYTDACNNLGSLLAEQGKPDEAALFLEKAIELNPNYAAARYNLGNALLKAGRTAEATKQFLLALQTQPNLPEAHYRLGNIFLGQGNGAEAQSHYLAALESRPEFAEVHYQLGVMLTAQKQMEAGLKHLQEAVRLKPDWLEALNNLAWILATHPNEQFRNGTEAVLLASRAVELTRTNRPGLLDTLAAAQAETGQFAQAATTAQQARSLALASEQQDLATEIQARLELYRRQHPHRTP